MLQKEAALNSM